MPCKGRIEVFARGQENDYTVDELYSCLADVSPLHIHQARYRLTQLNWHLTPPEEREKTVYEILQHGGFFNYLDLFCDFRCGGYRILGDIICDLDDMYRRQYIGKNMIKNDDSDDLKRMLIGAERSRDYKSSIIQSTISIIHSNERYSDPLDYDEAAKCAIALGKRQFALEVLPSSVCDLARTQERLNRRRNGGCSADD